VARALLRAARRRGMPLEAALVSLPCGPPEAKEI